MNMIVFFVSMYFTISVTTSNPIRGKIIPPFADKPRELAIVAYSRHGLAMDVSPVTHDASFTLHRLSMIDGDYILHVLGAVREEFDPYFVRIVNGRIQALEKRQDVLTLPGLTTSDIDNSTTYLNFSPHRKTNYKQEKQSWRFRGLWAMRFRFLQLAAVAFVIWFPQFIRSLPRELRDELMGETNDDVGDTTALFQALSGLKKPGRGQSESSSSSLKR